MSWSTEYLQIQYGPYGAPASNLTDHVRGYSITHPFLVGRTGIKFKTADGLADIPIGLAQTTDDSVGRWDFYIKSDFYSSAAASDLIGRIYVSDDESTTESKSTVASEYEFFGVPGSYDSGTKVLEDWVTGTQYAGSGGLSTSDLIPLTDLSMVGYVLDFTSGNYIEVPDINPGSGDFAFEFLQSSNENGGGDTFWTFWSNRQTGGAFTGILLTQQFSSSSGLLRVQLNDTSVRHFENIGTTDLSNGTYLVARIVVDRTADTLKHYVDGSLEETVDISAVTGSLSSSATGRIGGDPAYGGSGANFVGTMGLFRLSPASDSVDAIADASANSLIPNNQFKIGGVVGDGYIEYTVAGSYTFEIPENGDYTAKCWGGGAAGETGTFETEGGAGGDGGDFAEYLFTGLTAGSTYAVVVGDPGLGGSGGGDSYWATGSDVLAKGGGSGSTTIGDTTYAGGAGYTGSDRASDPWPGGGGGGGAGSAANGGAAPSITAGVGGSPDGGDGGDGGTSAMEGNWPGGGGGGGTSDNVGANGATGYVRIEWDTGGGSDVIANVPAGVMSFLGVSPVINTSASVPVGALTFTGVAASASLNISVPVGSISFVGTAPVANLSASVPAGTISFVGLLDVSSVIAAVPAGIISFTGTAIAAELTASVPVGTMSFSGTAPTAALAANVPAGAMAFSGTVPVGDISAAVPAGIMSLTGTAPVGNISATVPVGEILFGSTQTATNQTALVPVGIILFVGLIETLNGNTAWGDGELVEMSLEGVLVALADEAALMELPVEGLLVQEQ